MADPPLAPAAGPFKTYIVAMGMVIEHLADGGVLFRGTGVVTGEETVALNSRLYASEAAVRAIRYQLVDLLEVTDFRFESRDVQTLAHQDSRAASLNPHMPIALVMSDSLAYGMNRMYHGYFGGDSDMVRLFGDMVAARAWIAERLRDVSPDD